MGRVVPTTSRRALMGALTAAPVAALAVPSPWGAVLASLHADYGDDPAAIVRTKEGRALSRRRYHVAEGFFPADHERADWRGYLYRAGITAQLALSSHLLDMGFADDWCARHIGLRVAKSLAYVVIGEDGQPVVEEALFVAESEEDEDDAAEDEDGDTTEDSAAGETPVDPVEQFTGYSWYDALPRVLGCSFRIRHNEDDIFDYTGDTELPPGLVSGRVDEIGLEFAFRESGKSDAPAEVLELPADIVIVPGDYWIDIEEVTILPSADCTITPDDLASLLEAACFRSSEDCEADSYHTQQAAFEMGARFAANRLLLGEDTAIIERVRDAMREHVSWLIPKDRTITVCAVNHRVDAAFADNDDDPALDAAE